MGDPATSLDRRIKLAQEADSLVEEIRSIPGFHRFLMPKEFSDLAIAAKSGPIIVLNASKFGCDALILASPSSFHHLHLDGVSFERLSMKQELFRRVVLNQDILLEDFLALERSLVPVNLPDIPKPHEVLQDMLEFLWTRVVLPCLACLQLTEVSSPHLVMSYYLLIDIKS